MVGALKAASQSNVMNDCTLSQESSQEQESADYDAIAANSNNCNSSEYLSPVPSYGTKVNRLYEPSSAISESTWRNSPFYPQATHNVQSAVSQVTPSIHKGTPNSSPLAPHTHHSLEDHPSFSPHTSNGKNKHKNVSDTSADIAKHHYGMPASLDLLRRIQLHNKAISHYIEMQRQHQTPPLSVYRPSSISTNPSHLSHKKKQPTPSSSEYHDCTSCSAPSFKFVVPHPPSTPKPNFVPGNHRGVIRTTPIFK